MSDLSNEDLDAIALRLDAKREAPPPTLATVVDEAVSWLVGRLRQHEAVDVDLVYARVLAQHPELDRPTVARLIDARFRERDAARRARLK